MPLRLSDIRFAIRRLSKSLGTTIASLLALAFGIGATIATWALLNAVFFSPLPVQEPENLFQLEYPGPVGQPAITGHPYSLLEVIRESDVFAGTAASITIAGRFGMRVTGPGGTPRDRAVNFASYDYFATLGVSVARGRLYAEEDDRPGATLVAVLTDEYWRSAFGAEPDIIGETISVAGSDAIVIGILPSGFRGLALAESADLYLPLRKASEIDYPLFASFDPLAAINIVGRLQRADTAETAISRLNAVPYEGGPMRETYLGLSLIDVNQAAIPERSRADMSQFSTLLTVTVSLLLLSGCLTVGMLILVRTADRKSELAVCHSLGATRGRLAGGILAEAIVLSVSGALMSIPVALWFFGGIRTFQLPGRIGIDSLSLVLSPGIWLSVAACALVVIGLVAVLATIVGVGNGLSPPIQHRSQTTTRSSDRGARAALVAGQVAITLVLVSGAGLFMKSLLESLDLNPGIDTDRIVMASLDLQELGYTAESGAALIDNLKERLVRNDAIESAAVWRGIGVSGQGTPLVIDGERIELSTTLQYLAVDDDYFATIGTLAVDGRPVSNSDIFGAEAVVVVNASLARLISSGGSVTGRTISDWSSIRRVMMNQGPPDYLRVVGVVPDLIANVNTTEPLVAYQPIAQVPAQASANLAFRASGDPQVAMAEATSTLSALEPRATLDGVATLSTTIAQQMNPQRFGLYVLFALGSVALLLTLLGTFVAADSLVANRKRELSIRLALGAGHGRIRRLVLFDTFRLVGTGLLIGVVFALFGARVIRSLLFQVSPFDASVLLTAGALILTLALAITLRPAILAASADLTRTLKEE